MRVFILTLQFLTRLPINKNMEVREDDFVKGLVYFPLIGLIIGAIDAAVFYLVSLVTGGMLPVACALLANVAVTGGLHIDGLADTCDGIFSSRTRDRMLEIMKDSRIGTNGTIAIIFDFLLKFSILMSMDPRHAMLAVLLAPVAAKTVVVLLIYISDYAREKGMGGLYIREQNRKLTSIGLAIGAVLLLAFLKLWGLAAIAVCVAACLVYKKYIYSKIQGMTGDTLGAANEVIELVFMLALMVLWRYGAI